MFFHPFAKIKLTISSEKTKSANMSQIYAYLFICLFVYRLFYICKNSYFKLSIKTRLESVQNDYLLMRTVFHKEYKNSLKETKIMNSLSSHISSGRNFNFSVNPTPPNECSVKGSTKNASTLAD